jgi:Family of unknown function (DUF5681)
VENNNNDTSSYGTGYGKPPIRTRFKKGQSGNPKGRRKGSRNLASVLNSALQEKVTVNEGGVRKKVTKEQAALKQIANKAASGDVNGLRILVSLLQFLELRSPDLALPTAQLEEADEKTVMTALARWKARENGGSGK